MAKNKRKFKKSPPTPPKEVKVAATPFVSKLHFPDVSNPLDAQLRKIFWGLTALFFVITVGLAINSGINGDDSFQNDYSDQLVDWYLTMGQDTSAFYHPKGPIQYYGGIYEIPTGAVNRVLGLDVNDTAYHQIRHFFNALFGVLAMVFVGLFARSIGGWQAGIIGLILIFLSPRFLGHSLMNPKDIPFAAGYIMAIYFLAQLIKELPQPNNKTLWGLAGGVAIAFGTRAGGLILVPYIVMFIGLAFLLKNGIPALFKNIQLTGKYIAYGIIPIIAGMLVGILFWPYALVDPINHIPESLGGLTKYAINIRMLFEGNMIFGKEVPNTYLLTWIYQTVPLFAHLGLLVVLGLSWKMVKRFSPLLLFLALFTALFPVIYVIIKGSTLYDGWRHLQFAYLPLVSLIAVGWSYLIDIFRKKKITTEEELITTKSLSPISYIAIGILALTALEPAWFITKNKDYPYVYFNPLAGGIETAFGEYETDYWGTSMQTAMEWLEDEGIVSENMTDTITIASNFS
ncbi:MAG: ArnT family glycosyltransferase, partial [Saprospiraceae bacterium]